MLPVVPALSDVDGAVLRCCPCSYVEAAGVEAGPELSMEATYLASRMNTIQEHFPSALSAADFLFRLEMALCSYKLNGENSIGGSRTSGLDSLRIRLLSAVLLLHQHRSHT